MKKQLSFISLFIFIISLSLNKPVFATEESTTTPLRVNAVNSIEISLSTNVLNFSGYNGTEDFEKSIDIYVSSYSSYDLKATLNEEIKDIFNSNNKIDLSNLMIKLNEDYDYQTFPKINKEIFLSKNNVGGEENIHNLNIKLLGDGSAGEFNYKTSISFSVIPN